MAKQSAQKKQQADIPDVCNPVLASIRFLYPVVNRGQHHQLNVIGFSLAHLEPVLHVADEVMLPFAQLSFMLHQVGKYLVCPWNEFHYFIPL